MRTPTFWTVSLVVRERLGSCGGGCYLIPGIRGRRVFFCQARAARLRRQTRLFGLDDLVAAGRLVESAQEHHALLDAMQARDISLTRSVITSHIKHIRGLWVGRAEE